MNIEDLYDAIQLEFASIQLKGEIILVDDRILWSYTLESNEGLDYFNDDDEESFSFETMSSEERLNETYQSDYGELQEFLDNIEQTNHWIIADEEIVDNMISFEIY